MASSSKVTLKQVADAAAVSQSTASRALADNPALAEETIARVKAAALNLKYAPRNPNRQPGGNRKSDWKNVVGLVVSAIQNAFYPQLVGRLHNELDSLGYGTVLIIDELSNSRDSRKVQRLIDRELGGVIFTSAIIDSPAVDLLVAKDVPTVLAVRTNGKGNVSTVESDNEMSGREAAEHLLELGHRRLGAVMGPANTTTAVGRLRGYRQTIQAAGLELDPSRVIWGSFSHENGYFGLVRLMQSRNPPTAIFCGNDVIAIGALDASMKLGIAVPGELSLIGVDDIRIASWAMIALTTIRQDISGIAAKSAHNLVSLIESDGNRAPTHDVLPTSIVKRNTTAPAGSLRDK